MRLTPVPVGQLLCHSIRSRLARYDVKMMQSSPASALEPSGLVRAPTQLHGRWRRSYAARKIRDNGMRKLIVLEHITLDGVIQAPGGPDEDTSSGFPYGGWIAPYADEILSTLIRRQMNLPFDLLLGR